MFNKIRQVGSKRIPKIHFTEQMSHKNDKDYKADNSKVQSKTIDLDDGPDVVSFLDRHLGIE